jgi:uroporphyrin-III C-methyltransferase
MDQPSTPGIPASSGPRTGRKIGQRVFAVALVVLAAIVAALWLDTRGRIGATQDELARRLHDIETESREARALGHQAQEGLRDAQARIGALETRLAESQNQQVALEALYQELARNRDEWQLAEIEQVLAIAQQQLQLSGNVRAALLALQLAESRLSRADRPQFLPVRRALVRDIDRLKSLPVLDVPGLSLTIDRVVASVDALPLAFDERIERSASGKAAKAAPEREEGFFVRLGGEVWKELRQLVVVRKVESPEPPLLPPQQAWFLRENLKLRLLNARLALLTRDEAGYREDLRVAQAWILRYFDARAKASQGALAQLKQLSSASVSFEPPSITDSLEAVRGFKARRERGS